MGVNGHNMIQLKATEEYVNKERKEYALYVLQSRAIPHAADGLKHSARRVLWTARDGKKYKSATLAGATMPIHPHGDQSLQGSINTLAAPYGNNIPLLDGDGAFGTLLNPTAYGASRYTSAKISEFTKQVVFADIDIIPLQENYDGTLEEPVHFLPLIPTVLLNPQEGIAVGFASNILPRSLKDIVTDQIMYLTGKGDKIVEPAPSFAPTGQTAFLTDKDKNGTTRWYFKGTIERNSAVTVTITNLPYGLSHEKFIEKLLKLQENDTIIDFDDNSKDKYNIEIKFKKGTVSKLTDDELLEMLGLICSQTENFNVIDFDGKRVLSTNYVEFIKKFTTWRLSWYVRRYERLAKILADDIQRYKDVLRAVDKNVGSVARKVTSRGELKQFLEAIGIVHLDYIADLPVYRFTEQERKKVEEKLAEGEKLLQQYKKLINSEEERKNVFIEELKQVLTHFVKR